MQTADLIALLAANWLIGAAIWLVWSQHEGKALAADFAAGYPDAYAALGAPRPGIFNSLQNNRWSLFVMRREYRDLDDPLLVSRFDEHRRSERVGLVVAIVSLFAVSLMIWWLGRDL